MNMRTQQVGKTRSMRSRGNTTATAENTNSGDDNNFENKDTFNNNANYDFCDVSYKFSIIPSVSETETDSSDISLGDSDDADNDLTDTSETLDNESTTEDELDDITDDSSSPPSQYSLYTIIEEDECISEGLATTSPVMSDLQHYFLLLGDPQH